MNSAAKINLRKEKHLEASSLIEKGDFKNAQIILFKANEDFGSHVGLLSDLAGCYYQNVQFDSFEKTVAQLQTEFNQVKSILSEQNSIRTMIYLGKAFEELGQVSRSLAYYKEAHEFSKNNHIKLFKKSSIQLLRLLSYLKLKTDLSVFYKSSLQGHDDTAHLTAELEHGFMLAELNLFGFDYAKSRLLNILENANYHSFDKQLAYFDFLEESLLSNQLSILGNVEVTFPIDSLLPFEKAMFKLYLQPNYVYSATEIIELQKKMPLAHIIRIIAINLKRTQEDSKITALQKHLLLLIDSLDSESKQLLLKKFKIQLDDNNLKLSFVNDQLYFENKIILSKNKLIAKIIPLFLNSCSVSTETFIKAVFDLDYDEYSFERSRIALLRLNKELSKEIGLPKAFMISKSEVSLVKNIKINQ